jgi:hypothetical protein
MTEANLIRLDQRLADVLEGGKSGSAFNRNGLNSRGSRPEDIYSTA